jgi:hypothetical protein
MHCSGLRAINVSPSNQYYKAIEGVLFSKDGKTLHKYPAGKGGAAYTIPESVINIANEAFAGCGRLTEVTLPESVAVIGMEAFAGCKSLREITLPESVAGIGEEAFAGCNSLNSSTRAGIERRFGRRVF